MAKKKTQEEFQADQNEVSDTIDADVTSLEGIGAVRAEKLATHGITKIIELATRNPVDLADLLGMDVAETAKMIGEAHKTLIEKGSLSKSFITASDYERYQEQRVQRIGSGCKALNELFEGGYPTQCMIEFFGEFASGKTQVCHTLAITSQLPEDYWCEQCKEKREKTGRCEKCKGNIDNRGGLGASVVYIDTENTFSAKRIRDIVEERGLGDVNTFLDNIIIARAYNSSHQVLLMEQMGETLKENERDVKEGKAKPIKVIIVDSATGPAREDYLGRGKLGARQMMLQKYLGDLNRFAEVHNILVVITNQVLGNPEPFGQPMKAVGGHTVSHKPKHIVWLKKSGKKNVAKMEDSPEIGKNEVIFYLTKSGVSDTE